MRIKVLGCSGAELPGFGPPSFLLDGSILLDAGTTTAALDGRSQKKISHIILTHAHFDHVRGIPTLIDNMLLRDPGYSITVAGTRETLMTVKKHLFNNAVWPDFTKRPSPKRPALKLKTIKPGKAFTVPGYRIKAEKTAHTVPAVGYIIQGANGKRLLYTGDTGPTEKLWKSAGAARLDGVIAEVTFPNRMKAAAERTGHLTPAMLMRELNKFRNSPEKVFITHIKPQFIPVVSKELQKLKIKDLKVLKKDRVYVI